MVKVEATLTLLPPGHWPFLSQKFPFGQFRMLSEESCVWIVGVGGELRSHQSVVQPSLDHWSGFDTVGQSVEQRSALLA